jgi:hypothetical protein
MLELINAIPDEIGWSLVGAAGTVCVIMAVKVGKIFVEMWRERREIEEEEA